MGISEFDLIRDYFAELTPGRPDVSLGVGDDCALLDVPAGQQLAVSLDTLVEGRHFAPGTDPEALGHRCLAVNLSDLAAMGAAPAWVTLALTLPAADPDWLTAFARGFGSLAREHGVQLVGGDTTKGPLSITVQVHGLVPPGQALRRAGARAGDLVYVSGTLGDAGLALLAAQGLYANPDQLAFLRGRLNRPTPRLATGLALRGLASAAIDLSDGLGSDLKHICERSGLGATLHADRLPVSPGVAEYIADSGDWALPLSAGDDYELCITVPAERQGEVEALAATLPGGLSWVGMMQAQAGLRVVLPDGTTTDDIPSGYDHFANDP
jgi:thiamine-monophosphate kinase